MVDDRRALVIGLSAYEDDYLAACAKDAHAIAELLERDGDGTPRYRVKKFVGEDVPEEFDRSTLRGHLLREVSASKDEELLIFFSGHGGAGPWGTELLAQDWEGVSLSELMHLIAEAKPRQATVILDCCHAGTAGNLGALQAGSFLLPENTTILASSRAEEVSVAGRDLSAFTRLLIDGLNGAAADHLGEVTAPGLHAYATAELATDVQRPVFKTHTVFLRPLRTVPAPASETTLRARTTLFPAEDALVQVPPGDLPPVLATLPLSTTQLVFDQLRELHRAGMVHVADVTGERAYLKDRRDLRDIVAGGEGLALTDRGRWAYRLVAAARL